MSDILQTAMKHHQEGRLDEAEPLYRQLLREVPDHAAAFNNLGLLLQQRGQLDEAIAAFESALSAKPFWPSPYLNLAHLYRSRGQYHVACEVYLEGVRLCGETPTGYTWPNLGELLVEMGQPDKALLFWQDAARQQPYAPEILIKLGNVLKILGRFEEAKAQYQQAIRLAPALALPFAQMGLLLQAEGKADEAQSWFNEAARRDPNHSGLLQNGKSSQK